MKNLRFSFFFLMLVGLLSCGPDASAPGGETAQGGDVDSLTSRQATSLDESCKPDAAILDGNSLLIRERGEAVFIVADSLSYDEDFGPSHRSLVLIDLEKCEEVDRKLLPVNVSPDFPYQLADISYHRMRDVIAIKGLKTVLCYDLQSKEVVGPVEPSYKEERAYADAQSGNIERLEVWEDYLIGYATDMGAFAFVITADNTLSPYLPAIEYPGEGLAYQSLFLMPTADGKVQAIIPSVGDDGFSIAPLFGQPLELEGEPKAILPRFGWLGRTPAGEQVVVDVLQKERVELPEDLKNAAMEEIEAWLKEK
jgi:hypothetical protein